MKIYYHGLSPLLMQNPYSKFIFDIKTLVFDRFSKFLQVLFQQIEIKLLNRKHFPCLSTDKNSRQKFIIRSQFLHFKPQLGMSWIPYTFQLGQKKRVFSLYSHIHQSQQSVCASTQSDQSILISPVRKGRTITAFLFVSQ